MYLYLYIHLFTISYPLAQSFERRLKYATKWKALWPGMVATAVFFLVWDEIFTLRGVWGFDADYLVGLYVGNLPIEEILFFFTVPFASVFIYECVLYFIPGRLPSRIARILALSIGVLLIVLGILFHQKDYTFWTFLFTGILLLWQGYKSPAYLGDFFVAYLIHLLPFLLVNGVLTGSWIEKPIVWYNDAENLGIRITTIPIEDSIYAMLLLLMNVSFFEYFKKSKFPKQ